MTDSSNFAKIVPGFDFLQGLVKNAGAALPGIGQWVAPTLDPDELNKRIEELRTVQFWLEQNARMLGATIQALEVQRMTLSTLQTMNVQMEDLRDSLQIRVPEGREAAAAPAPTEPAAAPAPEAEEPAPPPVAAPPGVVDPMQWWGALTKQFGELAAGAMKEPTSDLARSFAGAMTGTAPASSAPASKAAAPAARPKRKPAAKGAAKTTTARKKSAPRR